MENVGDILLRLKSDDEFWEKVEQFACSFQKTYIRGTTRAPLFEPSIWNQNNAVCEGLAKTNNEIEGWQYGIKSFLGAVIRTFGISYRSSAKMLYSINSMPYMLWLATKETERKISAAECPSSNSH